MAWTAPRTWSACEIVTAALMNTHVRDNLNQTFPALVTTQGDSVWATGANAGQRVAAGGNGTLIVADSTCNAGIAWRNYAVITASGISLAAEISSTQETVSLAFSSASSGGCNLGAYGIGMGPTSNEGFVAYRSGTGNTTAFGHKWIINDQHVMRVTASGILCIGGSANNSNTFMTQGVTIMGACNNEYITLKGTTLKHGMTTLTETDTAGKIYAGGPNQGGLGLSGYTASTTGSSAAVSIGAFSGSAADTTKNNAANGIVYITAGVQSGNFFTLAASIGNILTIANAGCARFIFQGGGDLYADSSLSASAFDSHDDVQMVRALEVERSPGTVIRDQFDSWLKYNRKDLEAANIATFNDPAEGGDGSVFVNVMGLQRLHSGAIWQLHKKNVALQDRLEMLERRLTSFGACMILPPTADKRLM